MISQKSILSRRKFVSRMPKHNSTTAVIRTTAPCCLFRISGISEIRMQLPVIPTARLLKDPFHIYSAASHYPLTLKVTNVKGCVTGKTETFTVNGAVPLAALNVQDPDSLCSNQLVFIRNESSVDFGSITRLQIDWGDGSWTIGD